MTDQEIATREVIPFLYRQQEEVRTPIGQDGEPWFVLADICRVLEIQNPSTVRRALPDRHVGRTYLTDRQPDALIVSEGGMWRIVMRSNRPEAEAFQDWIADTVLPSIRKTGEYQTQARVLEVAQTVAKAIRAFNRLRSDADAKIDEAKDKVAAARHALDTMTSQFEIDVRAITSPAAWQYVKNELERQERSLRTGIPYTPRPVPQNLSTDPLGDED